MVWFLLLTDLLILTTYGTYALITFPAFYMIVVVLLFFLAARVLALSIHPAFSLINVGLLPLLRDFHPVLLLLAYLFYAALYLFLKRRDTMNKRLTEENMQLQVDRKNNLRYQLMKEEYDSQTALNTRLEERRAIAQQIHDLLGHSLTASTLQLEAAAELIDTDPGRAKTLMNNAAGQLRVGIQQVREAVHQMRADAPALKREELERLVDRFRLDSGMPIELVTQGDTDTLPNAVWQVILGNVREGLTNVIRHAQASQVQVHLRVLSGMVRLEVRDNGRGGDLIHEGMGISGMRERAQALGGSLLLRNDDGMRVITLIPRRETADDPIGSD